VTGAAFSPDFPTVNAIQPSLAGNVAFRTSDGGNTWTGISNGLRTVGVLSLAIDPAHTSTVYAGTYTNGVFKSMDGGATWTPTSADLPTLPVNALAVDAEGVVYAADDASLYCSRDGGESWTDVGLWTRVSSLAVDLSSSTVYAGASAGYYRQGVFQITNGGAGWTDTGLAAGVNSLAVSQSVIYAGTDSGVFKNAAATAWEAATAGIYEPVVSLAANPVDANQVYAGTWSGLLFTATGGAEWTPVPGLSGIAIANIAIAPSNPSTVYVATWVGSVMSDDAGTAWRLVSAGTLNFSFAIDPDVSTTVYAGSYVASDVFVARLSADGSTLEYATFLGGTDYEWASDIAIDSTGAAYVTGTTKSTDFPVLNPFQAGAGDLMDVFVAKITNAGELAYATYLAGSGSDYHPRIAVDAEGRAHVAGITLSSNFPTVAAWQPSFGGGYYDLFVTTLNSAGNGLVFSTFLGGSGEEFDSAGNLASGPGIAVGPAGETVVTGSTRSRDFPTRDAVQATYGGGASDAFVSTFDAAGHLQSSTYLGGTGDDFGRRVAVDGTGAVVVFGSTTSTDLPLRRALQSSIGGSADLFVARLADHDLPPPDTTAPSIEITSPAAADYLHTDTFQVSFSASDSESGLASGSPAATLDGVAVANGQSIQALTLALGPHALVVSASDKAGNLATRTVEFRVTATIDSLIAAVNFFTAQGKVDAQVSRGLLAKLSDAKQALKRGNLVAARSKLRDFRDEVRAQSGRAIAVDAAQSLLDDADSVLIAM
jgi:hypothetical protein